MDKTDSNWQALKKRVAAFDEYRTKIISYPKEYTDVWFPGHAYFCQWMTGDLQYEQKSYYTPWETRKPAILKKGVSGIAMGFADSYYHSFVKEPLTLDFSK